VVSKPQEQGSDLKNLKSKSLSDILPLEKQEPKRYIASAILERAKEPIAEEFMQAQEMGAQRRTSQGIGALSQGGSRAILGGLPQIADQERMGEMQRAGQYEQARQDALGTLGACFGYSRSCTDKPYRG
jgi:hypothetical protein